MSIWKIVSFISFLVLVFSSLMCMKQFRDYVIENWPSIAISTIGLLITLAIAFIIFNYETNRHYKIERQTFKRSFAAVEAEMSGNYGAINSLLRSYGVKDLKSIHLSRLDFTTAKSLKGSPLLYKYTGKEYMYAMSSYCHQGEITNTVLNMAYEEFVRTGKINEGLRLDILGKLEDTKKYLLILQIINQDAIIAQDVKWGPSSPMEVRIMEWLHNKPSIEILESELKAMSSISEKDREQMKKGFNKVDLDN